MKDVGLDKHVLASYNFTMEKWRQGQAWSEKNLPVVAENFNLVVEKIRPYWNQLVEQCSVARAKLLEYLNVLMEKVKRLKALA